MDLLQLLLNNTDKGYAVFSKKLIPDTKHEILGVRTPTIRKIAKEAANNFSTVKDFLSAKHTYHEEYMLHGLILGSLKINISELLPLIDDFIPHIDNWAVCDSCVSALKIIRKHKELFFDKIKLYLKSRNTYQIRFAIVALLWYYIDNEYCEQALLLVKDACCENYYVNMAVAWFYSVALVKKYDKAIIYLENKTLPKFVHNKSIQKAIESFRIEQKKKQYLRLLKI